MAKVVIVSTKEAQKTIEALRKMNLIDHNYKIKKVGDKVYIPVKGEVPGFEVTEVELEKRKRTKNLKECLEERLGRGDWPRSFSIVGDIALISLKDESLLKYGKVIAECIMRSQKNVKSVWAKLGTEGVERVAKLVHLGGEKKSETIYKEHGLRFKVDIARVYVNPSLAEEHVEIVNFVEDGYDVLDMFAGVGFFALHIATRRSARVVAIDINPYAVKLMIENIQLNKNRLKGTVFPVMADSGEFCKYFKDKTFDVVIMNLPHSSLNYIDLAMKLSRELVIAYVVGREEEVKENVSGLNVVSLKKVIDYAPYKYIWRVVIRV